MFSIALLKKLKNSDISLRPSKIFLRTSPIRAIIISNGWRKNPIIPDCMFCMQNEKFFPVFVPGGPTWLARGMTIGLHLYSGQCSLTFFISTLTMLKTTRPEKMPIITKLKIISPAFIIEYSVILYFIIYVLVFSCLLSRRLSSVSSSF